MKRLSFRTIRECRFETFPLGRMMSLPWTRPMVTSFLSNSIRRWAPPFSVMTTANMLAISLSR